MRRVHDHNRKIPNSAALAGSQYAEMSVEDAARLLGDADARPRRRAPARTPTPAHPAKAPRRGPAAKTQVQHMADIIAAAVGGLNTELTVILNATAIATRRLPSGHPAAHLLRQAEAATRRSAQKASKLLAFAQWSGVNQPHVSGDGGGI